METANDIAIFEWDEAKNRLNQHRHGVSFEQAIHAFADLHHSISEERLFCLGLAGGGVMTVRFTYRDSRIRIFGAGYWRKGQGIYDNGRQSLH